MSESRPEISVVSEVGPLSVGPFRINVRTWVYTTVTLMSLLVVYDGWQDLKGPGGIALVVIGPTIALATDHTFADFLDLTVVEGGITARRQWRTLAWDFAQFTLVAVPPLVVLALASLVLQQSPSDTLRSMLVLGVVSLGFWGGVAGWRVGLRSWRLILAIVAGLGAGLIVLAFQLALKPH